jgi:5-formyltetrahydrofolate cyclo-ligase
VDEPACIQRLKQSIRAEAEARRRAMPDKDRASRVICARLAGLPEHAASRTVMGYLDRGSEVRTRRFFFAALGGGKRVVVPFCEGDRLGLFLLESTDELAPGTFGIPEPKAELRTLEAKRVAPRELDLVVVPGVAFDRHGARLGHGKGYYDRLLADVRPDARLVGLAFECQVFPEIPTEPHDVCMDRLITETAVYPGGGRPARPASERLIDNG